MTKRPAGAAETEEAVKRELDDAVSHEILPGSVSWDPSYRSDKGPKRPQPKPFRATPARSDDYTKEELVQIAAEVDAAAEEIYWLLFYKGMGGKCHPFLEFAGLMSKYGNIVRKAAEAGVQFPHASEHTGIALPMEDHDAAYLAEKLRCIFGPALDHNPKVKAAFKRALFGE